MCCEREDIDNSIKKRGRKQRGKSAETDSKRTSEKRFQINGVIVITLRAKGHRDNIENNISASF